MCFLRLALLPLLCLCCSLCRACPSPCVCDHGPGTSLTVDCSYRGLSSVPLPLPGGTTRLLLHKNRLNELPGHLQLPKLDSLCLDHNRLTLVTPQHFEGFPLLRNLTIRNNRLSRITSWHFAGCPDLQYIDLSRNRITSFPADIIFRLRELQSLVLSHNRLRSLATDYSLSPRRMRDFKKLAKDIRLDLSFNDLELKKAQLLQVTSNVHTLQLAGNRRMDVQQLRLLALSLKHSRITRLDLSHLGILRFSSFIFANVVLRRLRKLTLSGNYISYLETGTFDPLESITELDLSDNRLIAIPNLLRNRRLMLLDLSNNLISGLAVAPALPPSLHTLLLNQNKMHMFDSLAFARLPRLRTLHLSNNLIKEFHVGPRGLEHVQELRLAGNWATDRQLRDFLGRLRELVVLDLSRNNVRELEANVSRGHVRLDHLNLSANSISQLHPVDIGARSVSVLDLSHNRIAILHDYVMPRLQELYLQHNRISNLHTDAFSTSVYLRVLDLSDNPVHTRTINLHRDIFRRITKPLRTLRLSGIDLDPYVRNSHWAFFREFGDLRELALDRCDIRAPPQNSEKLAPKLEVLSLAFNRLDEVNADAFRHAKYLRHLDMSHNNLHELDHAAFLRLFNLRSLHLIGNPFVCNCGAFPSFLAWMNRTNVSLPGFYEDELLCAHPEPMWNRSIRFFDAGACGAVFNSMPLVGGLVTAALILILAAVPFVVVSFVERRRLVREIPLTSHMCTNQATLEEQEVKFTV